MDPLPAHLQARRERRLALQRVAEAERSGALDQLECAKARARIDRRCINGGVKHRRRRGPNQKRQPAAPPPSPLLIAARASRSDPAPLPVAAAG